MKKFWKNLCVCSMAMVSALGMSACGQEEVEVSRDLDGDNVISAWEQIYADRYYSGREQTGTIVDINSLSDLKAINNAEAGQTKVYRLMRDIDCNGEAIAINLGRSILLGNYRVIKNFKLGDCKYIIPNSDNQSVDVNIKGLFYNGLSVYDLKLFMGYQQINFDNITTQSFVSPLVNISNIENIEVRGKLNIDRKKVDGLNATNTMDVSLLTANLNKVEAIEKLNTGISVHNCTVTGEIVYKETDTNTRLSIGGAMPHLAEDSDIYNILANVNITAASSGKMFLGSIVGENDGMVTTCSSSGTITAKFTRNQDSRIGGIVGNNSKSAEIKNCKTTSAINFEKEMDTSGTAPELFIGGIAGTNYGIMNYITSDSPITINSAIKCEVGGIAGRSEDGIITNVLSRGSINCNKVKELYISEMVGISKQGYYESAIVSTNVTVDNGTIDSNVYLGMMTIFEDLTIDAKFNADYTPDFKGILMTGKTVVYMKPNNGGTSINQFKFNLGLRNPYEYFVIDPETNNVLQQPAKDKLGNIIYDENNEPIMEDVVKNRIPDMFLNLYMLDTYNVEKYNISGDVKTQEVLTFTYAKELEKESSMYAPFVSTLDISIFKVNWVVKNLGFKFGGNHNELTLTEDMDISKFAFTIDKNAARTRYFDVKSYNGELQLFDKYIEGKCTFDEKDEMYSLLNNILVSESNGETGGNINVNMFNKDKSYIVLKISDDFAKSIQYVAPSVGDDEEVEIEDETTDDEVADGEESDTENEEDTNTDKDYVEVDSASRLVENFASNVQELIKVMLDVRPEITQYLADNTNLNDYVGEEIPKVRYVELTFEDPYRTYKLRFDVRQMAADEELIESSYIVYLTYSNLAR